MAAPQPQNQANQTELLKTLVFSGEGDKRTMSAPADKSLNALEFLRALETRRAANNWDQERTVNNAVSSLTGLAAAWWHEALVTKVGPTVRDEMKINYATWKRYFKSEYMEDEQGLHFARNLRSTLSQRPKESVDVYINRVSIEMFRLMENVDTTTDNLLHYTEEPSHPDVAAHFALPDNHAIRDRVNGHRARDVEKVKKATVQQCATVMVRLAVLGGLSSEKLRTQAYEYARLDGRTHNQFLTAVTAAAQREIDETTKDLKKSSVAVIAYDDEGNQVAVAQVGRKGSQRKTGTTTRKRVDPSTHTPGKKCDFCNLTGHVRSQCWKRKAMLEGGNSAASS
ncbi:MAG: hypothetical protein KAI66_24895, partial [Lentisphaeria bacterium]|nr:hypothetical protein [Lentisphaeria bacterium]